MDTFFAPPGRTERRKFKNQIQSVGHNPLMNALLKSASGLLVVVNEDRQIVTLNQVMLDFLGVAESEQLLGLRLGESLHCIHAAEAPNGCGTTPHCMTCGAVIAMMAAIEDNKTDEQVCALTAEKDGSVFDLSLLVRTHPLVVDGDRWILVFAQDITQQHFRTALERVFFHDINNMLTALLGRTELLSMKMPDIAEIKNMKSAVERLVSEISLQRELSRNDPGHAVVKRPSSLYEIRKEIDLALSGHPAMFMKKIEAVWPDTDVVLNTNPLMVVKVLVNMLVNALEATARGDRATLRTAIEDSAIIWEVWNNAYIPVEIQKRVFQRHFSTKARIGRGLGTYSMKLFGEQYLQGKVTFQSLPESGTTFTFRLPRL